ncbi:MAG: hypothetical protein K2O18_10810 [Oscillospiraceae bacterium]|nr:hypothetical protein [Oscillospiraceae bacterium]
MRKTTRLFIICVMLACLTGCGVKRPTTAVDGAAWSEDWITLAGVMGVEEPGHGLTLRDDKAAKNMSYIAWSIGEAQPYVNEDGVEKNLYDAQLVLLLAVDDSEEEARLDVDEWLSLAEENYTIKESSQQVFNGQEFTVVTYDFPEDSSTFARGVSAFAAFGDCAVSVELACQEGFDQDPQTILADVLEHCHYAAGK